MHFGTSEVLTKPMVAERVLRLRKYLVSLMGYSVFWIPEIAFKNNTDFQWKRSGDLTKMHFGTSEVFTKPRVAERVLRLRKYLVFLWKTCYFGFRDSQNTIKNFPRAPRD